MKKTIKKKAWAVVFLGHIPTVMERIGQGTEPIYKIYPSKAAAKREAGNWDDDGDIISCTISYLAPKKAPKNQRTGTGKE